MARVAVIVVAYRDAGALARCLASLPAASNDRLETIVIDNSPNGSETRTVAVRAGARYAARPENVGFCAGVNLGLRQTSGEFALLLNPDAYLEPDYIERLAALMDRRPELGSASGRILRGGSAGYASVDSLGIAIKPGRRPVDIGHGEPDDGRRTGIDEVFGVTAAAAMYRRSALDRVAVDGQVLPEPYFMYLDDVDLAWRLRLAGYHSAVDHGAIAWHDRHHAGGIDHGETHPSWLARADHERRRPDYVRVFSAANWLLTLVRNDDPGSFLRAWPRFAVRRLPADAWLAVQRPQAMLQSRIRFARLLAWAVRTRREIQASRVVSPDALRGWLP